MPDPTLTLNGRTLPFVPGETILEVARRHGIFIPTLCHLDNAHPTGACRVCVVEVEGARTLAPACAMPAAPNMVVRTDSPVVISARRQVLGMLLQSGNHNCASRRRDVAEWTGFQQEVHAYDGSDELCEVYGDCRLQSYSYRYQVDSKGLVALPPRYPLEAAGPLIVRDFSRCILCGRCIQACNDIQVNNAISHGYRGVRAKIIAMGDSTLERSECVACGECVQVCPVGALVEKKARYRIRPWQAQHVRTTCSYCGVGCQMTLHVKDDTIHKVTGVASGAPNLGRLCARGRYGYDFVHSPQRLTRPRVRTGDVLREATWDEALDRVRGIIAETVSGNGSGAVAMICSARSSNESLYGWQKLMREVVGSPNVVAPFAAGGMQAPLQAIERAPVTLLIASDLTVENPVAATYLKRGVKAGRSLIVIDHRETAMARHATLRLAARPGTETLLVNGLINAILARGRRAEHGDLAASVAAFGPAAVEAATGVPAAQLAAAVELLDADAPTMLIYGAGVSHAAPRFAALQGLLGNLDRDDGGIHHIGAQANALGAFYMGLAPDLTPGGIEPTQTAGMTFEELIADLARATPPRVRCLVISGENLAYGAAANPEIARALARIEHLIVIDNLESETQQHAAVVLPAAAWAEEDGTVINAEHRIQRFVRAIPPVGEAKPETWIATQLANRLGQTWPERSAQAWWDDVIVAAIPVLAGVRYAELGSEGALWPARNGSRVGARTVPWLGYNYVHRTLIENCTGVLESLPQHSGLGEHAPVDDPATIRTAYDEFLAQERLTEHREAIDAVLATYRPRPGGLIPVLQKVQQIIGYLPPVVQNYIALGLGLSAAAVYGVTSFYSFFTMKPRGRHTVRVCLGTACYVVGSGRLIERLREHLNVEVGETTADRMFSLEGVRCVGACGLAPVVIVDHETHGCVTFEKTREVIASYRAEGT
ncbi:MAG: NAD(P)H-dependent oxidoreductase subunit E [Kiritimatiellae bacterium]|nr:NAD(P)H-dependent oxidoreductase subunit E [Kiritimatiellia bacterium]